MPTFLILNGALRVETDAETIATLRRKGWADAPLRPDDNAEWVDGGWIIPPPPPTDPRTAKIAEIETRLADTPLLADELTQLLTDLLAIVKGEV